MPGAPASTPTGLPLTVPMPLHWPLSIVMSQSRGCEVIAKFEETQYKVDHMFGTVPAAACFLLTSADVEQVVLF